MQKDIQNMKETKSCKADFEICRLLGKGSYGSVYKVIRKSDKQEYAMKEVSLKDLSQKEREEAVNEIRM